MRWKHCVFLFIIAESLKFVKKQFFSRALAREGYDRRKLGKTQKRQMTQIYLKGLKNKIGSLGERRMGRETKTEGGQ